MNPFGGQMMRGGLTFCLLLGLLVGVALLQQVAGPELKAFLLGGLVFLPLAGLAVLAQLGVERRWARALGTTGLVVLVILLGFELIGLAVGPKTASFTLPPPEQRAGTAGHLVVLVGYLLVLSFFWRGVRRRLRWLCPLDAELYSHKVALISAASLLLFCFAPLILLGKPLITLMPENALLGDPARGAGGKLRDPFYLLLWQVPCAFLAVGVGVRRGLREAKERLGLVWPGWRQVALSVLVALLLVGIVLAGSYGLDALFHAMGWEQGDGGALSKLLGDQLTPLGALIVGVTAGIGEELLVRGVLQPRLGLFLSNLLFVSLHAFQDPWEGLILIFLAGLVFGLARRYGNTTVSMLIHGVYDFTLILLISLILH